MNEKLSMSQLNRITAEEFQQLPKNNIYVVLDDVRSGLNVGSIFRSADAFRIEKIFCCGYTPAPPHREVLKSALGATESVNWEFRASAMDLLLEMRAQGMKCYAIEQTKNSIGLNQFLPDSGSGIVIFLGNEVHGVRQEIIDACDGSLEIHQYGTKHSLNVAVCAGIVLFELTNKLSGIKK